MIFPRETTTHILSLLLYTHVKKNEVITFLHLNKCILIIPMGCSPIRLIPTYILPAIETILLERFRPTSFKTERLVSLDGQTDMARLIRLVMLIKTICIYFIGSETSDLSYYTLCKGIQNCKKIITLVLTYFLLLWEYRTFNISEFWIEFINNCRTRSKCSLRINRIIYNYSFFIIPVNRRVKRYIRFFGKVR